MKKVKKTAVLLLAITSLCMTTYMSISAQYGASQVRENQTYTLAQILTYAIEDEYLANARYTLDIEKFGSRPPFARIAAAEKRHIGLLRPLLVKYNLPVPEDRGAQYVAVPASLTAAMKAGVEGEKNNVRMYDIFLKQQLPEDVRFSFTLLRSASENHLKTFERHAGRLAAAQ